MGRQELYIEVPFQAVFGLQRNVRSISQAFALTAAEMEVHDSADLTEEERSARMSRASMFIMDELEFDANVVTIPLVFAIAVAAMCQFLVGYVRPLCRMVFLFCGAWITSLSKGIGSFEFASPSP